MRSGRGWVTMLFLAALGGLPSAAQPVHELCGACHTEIARDFKAHPHMAAGLSCDVCHGASVEHRESGGGAEPDRVAAPEEVPALCGSCHAKPVEAGSKITLLSQYLESAHGKALGARGRDRGPNCGTCHGVHEAAKPATIGMRCQRCHSSLPTACDAEPEVQANLRCAGCHRPHNFAKP